ncbi:CATRA system-associated protein [Actinomadura sp. WMMA1423]|uniref:CATRA system-associated protein n=1 Tax=Actinomadura sp. WMMA1423 TaxID=2591108 RepID=UPI0011469328|nr:CATRA system-associated protein [Actinomadura sp. WMMA1423]
MASPTPRLTAVVMGSDLVGEALRGYMALGAVRHAEIVANRVRRALNEAEGPQLGERQTSLIALARLLVNEGDVQGLIELAPLDRSPYADTTDLLILRAWRQILTEEILRYEQDFDRFSFSRQRVTLREGLLTAARLTCPSSLELLRLLAEGLDYLQNRGRSRVVQARQRDLGPARDKVSDRLAVADHSTDTLTITGYAPDRPSPRADPDFAGLPEHAVPLTVHRTGPLSNETIDAAAEILSEVDDWRMQLAHWAEVDRALTRMQTALQRGVPDELNLCVNILEQMNGPIDTLRWPPPITHALDGVDIPVTVSALLGELRRSLIPH